MQSLGTNSGFQIKFPKPAARSVTKPPKDPRESSLSDVKQIREPNFQREAPTRKIVKDMSAAALGDSHIDEGKDLGKDFEENIKDLLMENEILRKKIEFGSNMLDSVLKFDESRDVFELKTFVRANYKKFHGILDEIFTIKEELERTKERQDELEKESREKKMEDAKKPDEISPFEKEVKDLEAKIAEISKEIRENQGKNEKLREMVIKKPFFREYELMGKEEEGLKKQNQSLMEMIKREQEKKK